MTQTLSERSARGYLKNIPNTPCTRCGWDPDEDGNGYYPSLGGMAVDWIQEWVVYGKGAYKGRPFRLLPDQKLFLYRWYEFCPSKYDVEFGLVDEEIATGCGKWRFREALRMEATGGGKTAFMAAIALLEFAGPEEIAPVSPNIVIAANSLDQANILFGNCSAMVGGQKDEFATPLTGEFAVFAKKILFKGEKGTLGDSAGLIERVAAVDGTNEGGDPSLFICDELHEWGDFPTGDPDETNVARARVHAVIGKSTTKRQMHWNAEDTPMGCAECLDEVAGHQHAWFGRGQGRILNISTAGFDHERSLLGHMYDRCMEITKDPTIDPTFLVNVYQARPGLDLTKREDRIVACTDASPSAGMVWDVQARVDEWGKIPDHEWMRYYANEWVEITIDSWLRDHPLAWDHCKGPFRSNLDKNEFVIGIDMSLKRDHTAAVIVEKLPDGRFGVTSKVWRPEDYGGKVPYDEVMAYVYKIAKPKGKFRRKFQGVVYDPRYFEYQGQALEKDGFICFEFTQDVAMMAPAAGESYRLILERKIVHDGDKVLARHVKGASAAPIERGGFTLRKGKSKGKIDACIAMVMGIGFMYQPPAPEPMFDWG